MRRMKPGKGSLWLRALDSFDARQVPETGGGFQPFWSPDSQSIGFFAERKLYTLDLARGERSEICTFTGNPRGGSWSATGSIIFATTNPQSLMRVPSQGGKPATDPLCRRRGPPGTHLVAVVSSRRSQVPVLGAHEGRGRQDHPSGIHRVATPTSGVSVPSDTQAVYVAPGYLLFGRDTRLLHQPFDVETGQVSGNAVAVVDRLRMMPQIAFGEFSASNTGMLAYGRGWMRPINSHGSIVRERREAPSERLDDIAHQPCHPTGGDWSIPISPTAI